MTGRPAYPGPVLALGDDDEPTREASTLPDGLFGDQASDDVTLITDKSSASGDYRFGRRGANGAPGAPLPPTAIPQFRGLPPPSSPPRGQGFAGPSGFGRAATLAPLRVVAPPASSARWTVPEPRPSQRGAATAPQPRPGVGSPYGHYYSTEPAFPRPGALPRVLVGAADDTPAHSGEATDILPDAAPRSRPFSPAPALEARQTQPAPEPMFAAQPVAAAMPAEATQHLTPRSRAAPFGNSSPAPYLAELPVAPPSYVAPRTGPSHAAKIGALCGAASLVLSVGIGMLLLVPRRGTLRIELERSQREVVGAGSARGGAERAEVFIDGQKVCDVAPCIVTDLTPGPKTIRLIGPGIPGGSAVATAMVEAGRERLALVSMGGEAPVPAVSGLGELHVASAQTGVRVSVDGVDRGALPLDMKGVAAGLHRLRFDGGERYAPLEREVEVGAGRTVELDSVRLKLLRGRITIDDAPADARVVLVRNTPPTSERVLSGPWPMSVEVDAVRWQVIASKKGESDATQEVSFDDGQPDKRVRLELKGGEKKPATVAASEPEPSRPAPRSAPREAPASPPPAAARATPPEPPAAPSTRGSGTLSMNSLPLSKVLLDGRPLGSTPKVDVSVPAGTHTVTFVHPDLGRKSVTVTVRVGESASASVRFRRPE